MPKQPVQTHDETSAGGDSASEDGTTRLGVAVGDSRSPKKGDAVRDAGRDVEIVLREATGSVHSGTIRTYGSHTSGR